MYHNELFQPLIALGAHGAWRIRHGQLSDRDVRQMLSDILVTVNEVLNRGRKVCPGMVDQIWFPVCVWLDECLGPAWEQVGKVRPLQKAHFHTDCADTEFFTNLDHLLERSRNGDAAARKLVAVYADCLRQGFCGGLGKVPVDSYRERCAEVLSLAEPPVTRAVQGIRRRRNAPASSALMWIVPAVMTCALYGLYRFSLAQWVTEALSR